MALSPPERLRAYKVVGNNTQPQFTVIKVETYVGCRS